MSREFFRLAHVVFPGGGEAGCNNAAGGAGGAMANNGLAAVAPANGGLAAGAPAAGNMPAGNPPGAGQMTNANGGNAAAAQLAVGAYLPAAAPAPTAPDSAAVANPAAAPALANSAEIAGGGMVPVPANPAMAPPPAGEMAPAGGSAGDAGAGVGWRLGDQAHRVGQPLAFQRLRNAAPILENAWAVQGTATGGKDAAPKLTLEAKEQAITLYKANGDSSGRLPNQKKRCKQWVLDSLIPKGSDNGWDDKDLKKLKKTMVERTSRKNVQPRRRIRYMDKRPNR